MYVVAQSCLTLCNALDYSLISSFVHGILKARILEWGSTGDLPDPGIEPGSPVFPALQAVSLPPEPLGKP